MEYLKKAIKRIYEYWHERWVKAHFQNYKAFDSCLKYNGMARLSSAGPGVYRFVIAYCDDKLGHRLLEMGFVPGGHLTVIENTGPKGSIMVKVKGSKIALSNKIADKILLKGE
ncbi:MAG: ferrous iron transport protein A [Endomicrobium sp.]|jgi:Fe2+ transport system protein FeoA|nr:ferrous iron transport protein A [Endomicrobium sp.]